MEVQPLKIVGMDMTVKPLGSSPPSSANFVDGGKNPSQQKETLPIPQVPIRLQIRLMNIWNGRLDAIMEPLPF